MIDYAEQFLQQSAVDVNTKQRSTKYVSWRNAIALCY